MINVQTIFSEKKNINLLIVFKVRFISTVNGFEIRITFADKGASDVSISKIRAPSIITDFIPEMYVICIYDDDWFVEIVIEISEQQNEIHAKFMKKNGTIFSSPTKDDQCQGFLSNYFEYIEC